MTIQKRRRLTTVHLEPPRSWAGPGGRGPSTPHRASSHHGALPSWPTSLSPHVAAAPLLQEAPGCSALPVCPSASSSSQTTSPWQRLSWLRRCERW